MTRTHRWVARSWRRSIASLAVLVLVASSSLASPSAVAAASPPVLVAESDVIEVDENQLARLYGTWSDPDGDAVTLTASVGRVWPDGNGGLYGTWRWDAAALDGPDETQVTITATDVTGAATSLTFTYRIRNVAPEAWTRGPSFVPVSSRTPYYFEWSARDVEADTLTTTVDCGTGTRTAIGDTQTTTIQFARCLFPTAGSTSVGVRTADEDGGSTDGRMATRATTQVKAMADARLIIDAPTPVAGLGDGLGGGLAAADVNGDGKADIAIGSTATSNTVPPDPAYVQVVLGRPSGGSIQLGAMPTGQSFKIIGAPGEAMGRTIAAAGDVNRDGLDDLLVSAAYADFGRGRVYVVFGSKSTADVDLATMPASRGVAITGAADNDVAGWSAAGIGDFNGDGFDDIAVGAIQAGTPGESEGRAYVLMGRASFTTVNLGAIPAGRGFVIDAPGQQTGSAVAGGDVNGDGKADIIVGSAGGPYSNAAVIYGRTTIANVDAATMSTSVGFRIGGIEGLDVTEVAAADMDGDGYAEVALVHGRGANDLLGWEVSVVDGARTNASIPNLSTPTTRLMRVRSGDEWAGSGLAMFDWTRDGRADLVVGAALAKHNGPHSGSAYVIKGDSTLSNIDTTTLSSRWFRVDGDTLYGFAGDGVAGGDVTGDGVADLIVGAPGYSTEFGNRAGRVAVFSGGPVDTTLPTVTTPISQFSAGSVVSLGRPTVRVTWTGADTGSGIARYEVSQSTAGAPWAVVTTSTTSTSLSRSLAHGMDYRFRVRAIDRAGNVSSWRYGATFRLDGYSEASSRVTYAGSWRSSANSTFIGGKTRYDTVAGARATFTFTGTAATWAAPRGPTRGTAHVYIDGSYVGAYTLSAATNVPSRLIAAWRWSTSATRTISIRVAGTAGHPRIDVDGFYVIR